MEDFHYRMLSMITNCRFHGCDTDVTRLHQQKVFLTLHHVDKNQGSDGSTTCNCGCGLKCILWVPNAQPYHQMPPKKFVKKTNMFLRQEQGKHCFLVRNFGLMIKLNNVLSTRKYMFRVDAKRGESINVVFERSNFK